MHVVVVVKARTVQYCPAIRRAQRRMYMLLIREAIYLTQQINLGRTLCASILQAVWYHVNPFIVNVS